MKKKDLIYCFNSKKYYWYETSIVRTFEEVLLYSVTLSKAKEFVKVRFGEDKEVIDVAQEIMDARLNVN